MHSASRFGVGVALSVALLVPASARAQTENADTTGEHPAPSTQHPAPARAFTPSFGSLFSGLGNDFRQLTTKNAFLIMGIGGGAALGAHTFDRSLSASALGWSGSTSSMLGPGQLAGSMFVQSGAAFATYVAGRAAGSPRAAQVGAELVRAQFVAQGVTQAIKISAPRMRPDGTTMSFPSGHTASSFATATVLQREFGWKVGIPAYLGAAWVGASRVQAERHYLSDVVAGATIGILAGRAVTVGSGSARFSLGPMAVPGGGIGVSLVRVKP